MNFNASSIVNILVIVVVAVVLFWVIGQFVPLLGLPGVVTTLLQLIVGVGALVAILRSLGLLS